MRSKKMLLKGSQLYVILDKNTSGLSLLKHARVLGDSQAGIVQYRDKSSKRSEILKNSLLIKNILSEKNKLFIINDYLDIAKIVDSDGVHLGHTDITLRLARKILGSEKIIGRSCHSFKDALLAQKEGADYIGVGPIFASPTKPEYKPIGLNLVKRLNRKLKIPFFLIGDINKSNLETVLASGAKRLAVCRAVLKAKNIPAAVKYFNEKLSN